MNVAELGIGTNEKAILTGELLEDEKTSARAHVAFGRGAVIGGTIQVPGAPRLRGARARRERRRRAAGPWRRALGGSSAALDSAPPTPHRGRLTQTTWSQRADAVAGVFCVPRRAALPVLLAATIAALAVGQHRRCSSYDRVWETHSVDQPRRVGAWTLDLRHWLNSGLMTFFFFVVGLEAQAGVRPRRVAASAAASRCRCSPSIGGMAVGRG